MERKQIYPEIADLEFPIVIEGEGEGEEFPELDEDLRREFHEIIQEEIAEHEH